MPSVLSTFMSGFRALHERSQRAAAQSELAMQKTFHLVKNAGECSNAHALTYAKHNVRSCFYRFDTHVAWMAVFLVIVVTGSFIPFGSIDNFTRISVISLSILTGTLWGFFIGYFQSALHLRFKLSHWALMIPYALACATLFSLTEPLMEDILHTTHTSTFRGLFFPVFVLYLLCFAFIFRQIEPNACYLYFEKRHQTGQLASLLPDGEWGAIYLVSAADHYVEIFAEHGNHIRRMTMKTAVSMAGKTNGLQVHRSHWASYKAMLSLEKDGERYFLTLRSGKQIPVSSKMAPIVQCYFNEDCVAAAE